MSRRVNPIMLLGLIVVLILALGILASAQLGGGAAGDALGVGEAQVGKPFRMASDGPDAFSCAGLMRYIMRIIGADPDAPFSPEGYLGAYPSVAPGDLQPGDIVIFPGHATMYAGNGTVLNANEVEGMVTNTPMDVLGAPLGIVRPPYGGGGQPPVGTTDPAVANNPTAGDPTQPVAGDPAFTGDPALAGDPALTGDPALPGDPTMVTGDPTMGAGDSMMGAG